MPGDIGHGSEKPLGAHAQAGIGTTRREKILSLENISGRIQKTIRTKSMRISGGPDPHRPIWGRAPSWISQRDDLSDAGVSTARYL